MAGRERQSNSSISYQQHPFDVEIDQGWDNMMGDIVFNKQANLWFAKSIENTKDMKQKFVRGSASAVDISSTANDASTPAVDQSAEDTLRKPNKNDNSSNNPNDCNSNETKDGEEEFTLQDALEIDRKNSGRTDKIKKAVFIAFKVKRLSNVANVEQTFRMKFHIYFNWLPTEAEYIDYQRCRGDNTLHEWKPFWYPHLEFVNEVEEHRCDWETYPSGGQFRMETFKTFGKDQTDKTINKLSKFSASQFDAKHARFIRAKMDCDITFSEVFELNNFPLDCQDLTCVIEERSKDIQCKFMPELRKQKFTAIDQTYSVINEWSLKNAILQLGKRTAGRTNQSHPVIELRLKVERKWHVFFWRIIFFVLCMCIMDLTAFALNDFSDVLGDRLALIVTLILTLVAFSIAVDDQIPNVPYLTYLEEYILACYIFTTFTMIQTALGAYWGEDDEDDLVWFKISIVILVLIHVYFFIYGLRVRVEEKKKLYMTGDALRETGKEEKKDTTMCLQYDDKIFEQWRYKCLQYVIREDIDYKEITKWGLLMSGMKNFMEYCVRLVNKYCCCLGCNRNNGHNSAETPQLDQYVGSSMSPSSHSGSGRAGSDISGISGSNKSHNSKNRPILPTTVTVEDSNQALLSSGK